MHYINWKTFLLNASDAPVSSVSAVETTVSVDPLVAFLVLMSEKVECSSDWMVSHCGCEVWCLLLPLGGDMQSVPLPVCCSRPEQMRCPAASLGVSVHLLHLIPPARVFTFSLLSASFITEQQVAVADQHLHRDATRKPDGRRGQSRDHPQPQTVLRQPLLRLKTSRDSSSSSSSSSCHLLKKNPHLPEPQLPVPSFSFSCDQWWLHTREARVLGIEQKSTRQNQQL